MKHLALALLTVSAQAAVIQGVVLDEESGNPLARTVVDLTGLPGTKAGTASIRAGERGAFAFPNVAPGWYILRCTRKGFVPAEVGQLRPGRPGMPFEVTPDSQSSFFQIRMRRLGAVTGTVEDENNVGIPDWPVHLYTAAKPVRHIAETKTDDRGNYRIGELEAGSYVVRSGPGQLEDETPLRPTYYKYGTALENAEAVRVRVGETQPDVVMRPVKGRLIVLAGMFSSQTPASLTMITDLGRRVVATSSGGAVPFDAAVSPGMVEFVAEGVRCGGYARLAVEQYTQGIRIACGPLEPASASWTVDNGRGVRQSLPLWMRRVDLDGTGPVQAFRRVALTPGHWEFQAQAGGDYCVRSITAAGSQVETKGDGWFGVDIGTAAQILVALSSRPGTVSGTVTSGGKPVAGAAVYLELYDPEAAQPRLALFEGRCDAAGNYKFGGLAPGRYRVLSSFDFDPEDRLAMEKAAVLSVREGDGLAQGLELALP